MREGHAVPHARSTPYLPVLELLRDYFGIVEEDGPEESRDKIRRRVVPLVPDLEEELPVMFEFLGVGESRGRVGTC